MKNDDSETLKAIKRVVKSDLSKRYQNDDVKVVMNITTFLDPRYKELPFLSAMEKKQVIEDVHVELCNILGSEEPQELNESDTVTDECDQPAAKKYEKSIM